MEQDLIIKKDHLIKYTGSSKKVVIPDGIKRISEDAFCWCESIESVEIPKSVTSIGKHAFWSCKNLGSITIPDSVTSIEDNAFENCKSLTNVVIPQGIKRIGHGVFQWCESLTSVSIPNSVTDICDCAFYYCINLANVSIPDSVTSIGRGAFANTPFLNTQPEGMKYVGRVAVGYTGEDTNVVIKEGTKVINAWVFYNCSHLVSVTIPDSVTSIGEYAFSGCSSLASITIPESVTCVGPGAFHETPWFNAQRDIIKAGRVVIGYKGIDKDIVIPESVTSIGESAFSDCKSLTSVTIPDSVTSIGRDAFSDCSSLTSITINGSVTRIGKRAFAECVSLKVISIPESVTRIEENTFFNCSSLTSITINDGVTKIGKSAFAECVSLKDITIPESVRSIEERAFAECVSLNDISIPESVITIGDGAFYSCKSLKSITIPDSVKIVGEDVFDGCAGLKKIVFLGDKFKFGKTPFGTVRYSGGIPKGLRKKCFSLIPRLSDGMLKEYILETNLWGTLTSEQQSEVFISRQSKTLNPGYLQCITDEQLAGLGNALEDCLSENPSARECAAAAFYMTGFKNKIPVEKLKTLYALLQPAKAASKALETINGDLALKEKLGQELSIDEDLAPAERLVMEKLLSAKKTQKDLENQLKEYYGITYADLPPVMGKDGKEKVPYVLAWLLQAHENILTTHWGKQETSIKVKKGEICQEAKEVLDEIDEESFQAALIELSKKYLAKYVNTKKKYLCYPISRYSNETVLAELTKEANNWRTSVSGIDAPPLLQLRTGCLYNNTRAAMLFAERYHDLDEYARIRGTDADTLRNTVLSEVGLDESGKKSYDLGRTILEAELQDDLTISLYDQRAQKSVKSVPKKNADPAKYEAAKKDLSDIRKNVRKIAKARNITLFEAFLSGKEYDSKNWKSVHFSNPLLNRIARLLVWEQGGVTFTLAAEGAIDSAGLIYSINDKPIKLAHPMEMTKSDIDAWQKYYTNHDIKQPFAQVWEPVIDSKSVKRDRYSGIVLPLLSFNGKDKHGIIGREFKPYSDQFNVEFKDCDLELEPSRWRLDPARYDELTFTLGKFRYKKYTRYTNHIVGILDGWTVEQRILKDDVSVVRNLESFTLAQITDFIKQASEKNCNNVTAALLEYKNNHFADFDPMDSFWLEDF